jgi:hypothetical protein
LVDKRKIALTDIIDALKQYGVIEQDRLELADNTKEESIVLKNILLSKWNEIGFDKKIIFHILHCHIGVTSILLQKNGLKMLKTG